MRYQPIIQRSVALAMLVLFVFSITPKRYLHDWFANHKDVAMQLAGQPGQDQIHSEGISCDCNNLVATSPFTSEATIYSIAVPIYYGPQIAVAPVTTYSTELILYGLRGPPALA